VIRLKGLPLNLDSKEMRKRRMHSLNKDEENRN